MEEAQALKDTYFAQYPGTLNYLNMCEDRVRKGQYLVNSFGRRRRFRALSQDQVVAEQIRQGWNFAIQSTVADAVNCAIYNFLQYREETGLEYRLALQIHDELILEVPYENVERVVKHVMQECMVNRVPIRPRTVDGKATQITEPYRFSIDIGVNTRWGEAASTEFLASVGIHL
jgi:DNA polymerase-1